MGLRVFGKQTSRDPNCHLVFTGAFHQPLPHETVTRNLVGFTALIVVTGVIYNEYPARPTCVELFSSILWSSSLETTPSHTDTNIPENP